MENLSMDTVFCKECKVGYSMPVALGEKLDTFLCSDCFSAGIMPELGDTILLTDEIDEPASQLTHEKISEKISALANLKF